jgi:hypothetical protein|eukprot:COSAG02_NODE_876_length_16272_cov_138.802510_4_plen_92_part_00
MSRVSNHTLPHAMHYAEAIIIFYQGVSPNLSKPSAVRVSTAYSQLAGRVLNLVGVFLVLELEGHLERSCGVCDKRDDRIKIERPAVLTSAF